MIHVKVDEFSSKMTRYFPRRCADDKPFPPIYQVSKDRARSLGLDYIPLEQSLKETVESLKEKGLVKF